jgi:hypothetical protein
LHISLAQNGCTLRVCVEVKPIDIGEVGDGRGPFLELLLLLLPLFRVGNRDEVGDGHGRSSFPLESVFALPRALGELNGPHTSVWFEERTWLQLIKPPSASEPGMSGQSTNFGIVAVIEFFVNTLTLPIHAGRVNSWTLTARWRDSGIGRVLFSFADSSASKISSNSDSEPESDNADMDCEANASE